MGYGNWRPKEEARTRNANLEFVSFELSNEIRMGNILQEECV